MRFLANYVMRGPMQAILVTSVSGVLALLLLPLVYISGAAVALVTLALGPKRGMTVAGASALAVAVLAFLALGSAALGPGLLLGFWVPIWVLALHLWRTTAFNQTVVLAGLFGAAIVLGIHLFSPDPAAWWQAQLMELLGYAMEGQEGSLAGAEATLAELSQLMTGVLAALVTLSLLMSLFIARYWQAMLYNPGGFRDEFHGLRGERQLGVVTAGLVLLVAVFDGALAAVARDLLIVALVLYVLHGIALVHGLVRQRSASKGWLFAMYGLLVVALPQTMMLLALAGFADSWFDFRRFAGKQTEP